MAGDFDFGDAGAEIGQHRCAERAGQDAGEVENLHAVERE